MVPLISLRNALPTLAVLFPLLAGKGAVFLAHPSLNLYLLPFPPAWARPALLSYRMGCPTHPFGYRVEQAFS